MRHVHAAPLPCDGERPCRRKDHADVRRSELLSENVGLRAAIESKFQGGLELCLRLRLQSDDGGDDVRIRDADD